MEQSWPIEIVVGTIDEMCEVLLQLRFRTNFAVNCQKRGASEWVIRVRPVAP